MTSERRVFVYQDKQTLSETIAERLLVKLAKFIAARGEATIVLTGGTMGSASLAAVAASPNRDRVDWSKVNFWWGDERWLPDADPERNETQAREALLAHIPVDEDRVHPFPASDEGLELDEAAELYAAELKAAAPEGSDHPAFDITFLGVGPDGHIASLFPERPGIRDTEHVVIPVRNSPKPPPERLSLTLPVINSSERIWLMLAGTDKASALGLALADASVYEVPVSGARGRRSTKFLVDQDAASEVPENLITPDTYWTAEDDPQAG